MRRAGFLYMLLHISTGFHSIPLRSIRYSASFVAVSPILIQKLGARALCLDSHLDNHRRALIDALSPSRSIYTTRAAMQAAAAHEDAGRDGEPLVEVERKFALVPSAEEAIAKCMTFVKEVREGNTSENNGNKEGA